jgi:hypothetical protein
MKVLMSCCIILSQANMVFMWIMCHVELTKKKNLSTLMFIVIMDGTLEL